MLEIELLERYKQILIFLFIPSFLLSQSYPDYKVNFLLKTGIESMLNQDYDNAENIFLELRDDYPNLPIGNISLNSLLLYKMNDLEQELNLDSIYSALDSVLSKSKSLQLKYPNSIWHYYYCGVAEANYALFESEQKNYLSSLNHSGNAIEYIEKCLEIDSLFYDAYGVIGGYYYWKSVTTEFLHWLPFFSDESEKGIYYSEIASLKGNYNRFFASVNLFWIYYNAERYDEAKLLVDRLSKEYPNNRRLKWCSSSIYPRYNKRKAISILFDLLNSYSRERLDNRIQEIVINHKIAMLYTEIEEFEFALEKCNYILGLSNLSDYTKSKINDRIDRTNTLKKEILEKLNSSN